MRVIGELRQENAELRANRDQVRKALQQMVDEAAHLAGFSESTERTVLAALNETPQTALREVRPEAVIARAQRAEVEPVAWIVKREGDGSGMLCRDKNEADWEAVQLNGSIQPLYTHPPSEQIPGSWYECMAALVSGIASWAQQEGGVPDELWSTYKRAQRLLAAAPPARTDWIACSEQLPTESDAEPYNCVIAWDAEYKESVLCYRHEMNERRHFTHWKPTGLERPEPPEET